MRTKANKIKEQAKIENAMQSYGGVIEKLPIGYAEGANTSYVRWGSKMTTLPSLRKNKKKKISTNKRLRALWKSRKSR